MNPFHYRELDPDRAGRAAGRGRVRDQPAARAAARAAAAPATTALFGSLVDAQLAGPPATWHPAAAPGGGRGPDDRLRAGSRQPRRLPRPRRGGAVRRPTVSGADTARRGRSAWCCTPTCRGWRTPAPGRSARSGCTRRSPAPGGGCSRCWTGWPPTGARDVLTLGVTPVLAAMLDDPYCLRELHTWAGSWQLRAAEAAPAAAGAGRVRVPGRHRVPGRPGGPLADRRAVARCCGRWSTPAWSSCSAARPPTRSCRCWSRGSRPARSRSGWTTRRCGWAAAPAGIWVPECGHAPGQEDAVRGRRGRAVPGRRPGAARRHRRGPAGRSPARRSASAATSRSPTGSGHRGPATRARRTTATSTPSTTPPGSARPG